MILVGPQWKIRDTGILESREEARAEAKVLLGVWGHVVVDFTTGSETGWDVLFSDTVSDSERAEFYRWIRTGVRGTSK